MEIVSRDLALRGLGDTRHDVGPRDALACRVPRHRSLRRSDQIAEGAVGNTLLMKVVGELHTKTYTIAAYGEQAPIPTWT